MLPETCTKRRTVGCAVILICLPTPCTSLYHHFQQSQALFKSNNGNGALRKCYPSTSHFYSSASASSDPSNNNEDNKAMEFLKKIGKIGGNANRDFRFAVGFDEGPTSKALQDGMKELRKSVHAYKSCIESGVVDDMTEPFPMSSCGTKWDGFSDRVMGGISNGQIVRVNDVAGRIANVLRGKVSLENNGGFVQMALNLANKERGETSIDASKYEGIELDLFNNVPPLEEAEFETFNLHLKTQDCLLPFSSYRVSFDIPFGQWKRVRLPFHSFLGKGPGASELPLDKKNLTRLGVVAIGKEMTVDLAVSNVCFY